MVHWHVLSLSSCAAGIVQGSIFALLHGSSDASHMGHPSGCRSNVGAESSIGNPYVLFFCVSAHVRVKVCHCGLNVTAAEPKLGAALFTVAACEILEEVG